MKPEVQMPARCKRKPNARELQRTRTEKIGSCGTQVKGVEVAVTERKRPRWNSTELNRTGPGGTDT